MNDRIRNTFIILTSEQRATDSWSLRWDRNSSTLSYRVSGVVVELAINIIDDTGNFRKIHL